MNKKQLEIYLSKLETVKNKNINLEQYQIEGDLAAEFLLSALNDVKGKIIADFGCGNGILGIGALILGAKFVYFVDIDKNSLVIAQENCKGFNNTKFINCDVIEFNKKVDTVIMNPPFGVQQRKADKNFLLKAFEMSENIYSMHKIESENFIYKICKDHNFKVLKIIEKTFLIKKTYHFHKNKIYSVNILLLHLQKNNKKIFK